MEDERMSFKMEERDGWLKWEWPQGRKLDFDDEKLSNCVWISSSPDTPPVVPHHHSVIYQQWRGHTFPNSNHIGGCPFTLYPLRGPNMFHPQRDVRLEEDTIILEAAAL